VIVFLDTSMLLAACTSDKADFGHVLGTVVYGVNIRTPKTFLLEMGLVE